MINNIDKYVNNSFILINGIKSLENFYKDNISGKMIAIYVCNTYIDNENKTESNLVLVSKELDTLEEKLEKLNKKESWGDHSKEYYLTVQSIKYYSTVETHLENYLNK